MTRINLLPWREELREEKKKEFLQYLAFVGIVAAGIVFLAGTWVDGDISDQKARNGIIEEGIRGLDAEIATIETLQQQKERMEARIEVIQRLQGDRPVIVRVFDELVRTLDEGVFYSTVNASGQDLTIAGVAESNSRISELMRNLDESEWFDEPNLKGLKEAPAFGPQASTFDLTVKQVFANRNAEEE